MRLYQRITGINKKRISKLIVVTILFLSVSTVFLNSSIVVYAWSAGGLRSTIASIIVSMLMSSGAGVTNMDWLTQLNNAYGVESSIGTLENAISQGLLTESAGTLIDTGLSDAIMANSAYTDLGLDALFTTTADDALIQAGTVAASGGANIASESIGAITLGTVGQAFVAVGAGIGLGVLAHHFIEKFAKPMLAGQPINSYPDALSRLPDGYTMRYFENGNRYRIYFCLPPNCYAFSFMLNGDLTSAICNLNDQKVTVISNWYKSNGDYYQTLTDSLPAYGTNNSYFKTKGYVVGDNDLDFYNVNTTEMNEIIKGWKQNNNPPSNYSPDVIGSAGNQTGSYINNNYIFPNITPYYNPEEKGLTPIPMEDYMDFARDAIDNTENGDIDDLQGDLFDNFINPYLEQNEPVIPEPEPDYTDPTVIPDQPDYNPKTPVSDTDISDSDPYTTPDLMDRFPFCIPNDILSIFQKFKMGREAPVIDWEFQYEAIGLDHHLVIDFEDFDDAASLLRTLELILFVVGLGVATRKLIGA